MDLARKGIYLLAIMALCRLSMSTVYKVGESAGWTTAAIGKMDYIEWAASKTFYVQDIIVFEYDAGNHNVIQVNLSDFHSCNGSIPMGTYATGNDSITMKYPGHYYYICGFPGHCESGMKVDIRVLEYLQSTNLVSGNASGDNLTVLYDDSPDGITDPANNIESVAAAHYVISSTCLLSTKLEVLLFLIVVYLFCFAY